MRWLNAMSWSRSWSMRSLAAALVSMVPSSPRMISEMRDRSWLIDPGQRPVGMLRVRDQAQVDRIDEEVEQLEDDLTDDDLAAEHQRRLDGLPALNPDRYRLRDP